jgi:REP element-mobilizing transposase RayT
MILGFHIIVTAYGFWLPNDPRGSYSDFIRAWELLRFGRATKVNTTRSVAHKPHDYQLRMAAKQALRYPPVVFTGIQALAIAAGFREVMEHWNFAIYACSIMPEHTHLVIGRTDRRILQVMNQLKGRASLAMADRQLHPFQNVREKDDSRPSPWARKGWKVFLDTHEDMRRAIAYTEDNPLKEGLRRQRWPFVTPYHS